MAFVAAIIVREHSYIMQFVTLCIPYKRKPRLNIILLALSLSYVYLFPFLSITKWIRCRNIKNDETILLHRLLNCSQSTNSTLLWKILKLVECNLKVPSFHFVFLCGVSDAFFGAILEKIALLYLVIRYK